MSPDADAPLLEQPADRGAALLLLQRLDTVTEAWSAWLDEPSMDTLHAVRTASRRALGVIRAFRGWLGGRGAGKLHRKLRNVLRATSPVRDLDVQRQWLAAQVATAPPETEAGTSWLSNRLEKRRARLARKLPAQLPDLSPVIARARQRLADPGDAPHGLPRFGLVVAAACRAQADRLAASLAGVLSPADQMRAHRGRVQGKRLRYLLEPLVGHEAAVEGPLAQLSSMQDDLGALHDAQVMGEVLAEALRRAGPAQMDGIKWLIERGLEAEHRAWEGRAERWLGGEGEPVVAAVRGAAAALEGEASGGLPIEIERKYLLSSVPPTVLSAPSVVMRQGYLPGVVIVERLRHVQDGGTVRRWRTIKAGTGIARIELEEEVEPALFDALWSLTAGRRLEKRRYRVPEAGLTWEVDVFTDREGLVLAEVELPSASIDPALPYWLRPFVLREVTGEPAYLNSTLAR